jgi:hypothetical protein
MNQGAEIMNANKSRWLLLGILALVSALVYLPLANKMGLYKDDWFLIYDAHTQGAHFFHEIYKIDRPARAYVMQVTYDLFGDQVVYYHLSAYLYRLLASWALFWALDMIWPRYKKPNFLISLLFLIYPGFLSQINPIDYQAQLLSLCLATSSIAFTVKSIKVQNLYSKIGWIGLSLVTGMIYPALVEYFLGLEMLRLSFIVQLVLQENQAGFKESAKRIFRLWFPFLGAPAIFLVWRIFFFETERRATDIGLQVGQVFASPLTGLWWLVNWVQDAFRVMFLAWAVPFNNLAFNLRLKEFLIGTGLGVVIIFLVVFGLLGPLKLNPKGFLNETDSEWRRQTLFTGVIVSLFALLPVIVVNRHADFGDYSRYTLASSAGVAMLITALIFSINSVQLRVASVIFLTFIASLTHYANAVHAVEETENIRNFWWQVTWRAPDIKPETTLVASYPVGAIQEDYFIWGPANLIYYPEKQNVIPIKIKLPAAVLSDEVVLQIIAEKGEETPLRRGNELTRDFGNILVMTRASENSCIRLIDGNKAELSTFDPHRIMLIASHSQIDNVITQQYTAVPPPSIFGDEPQHDWCFYYQKADLARQRGDWKEVARLGDEAQKLGLHPNDQIELMPFLQAYAFLGDQKQVKGISTRINTEIFYRYQACILLSNMGEYGYPLSSEIQNLVEVLFCVRE